MLKMNNSSPIPQWEPKHDVISKSADMPAGNEDQCFVLSFRYYSYKKCEIDFLEKNRAREALKVLKNVGKSTINTLRDNHIDKIPVSPNGEYSSLFKGLPPDFDVFEHKIQGDSRLFYSYSDQVFYIVLIKNNHFDTSKTR